MYCYRSKVNSRLFQWATNEGAEKAPLLFETKKVAQQFGTKVLQALPGGRKQWRLEQTEKLQPCWVCESIEDGKTRFRWEGNVSRKNLEWKIRHPEGLGALEQECREVFESVGKYIRSTYEQWELGFMYDEHPDQELALWRQIGDAHRRYMIDHPDADPARIAALLATIPSGSTRSDTEAVRSYYTGPIKPFVIEKPTPQQMELMIHPNLAAAIPSGELRELIVEWTEKAMRKECDTEQVVVWTAYGEIVIFWDWEKRQVLAALKTDLPGQ